MTVTVLRFKIPFVLPDWAPHTAAALETYLSVEAGFGSGIFGKIRNVEQGDFGGTIIELIPGFIPTTTQKANAMAALKKIWTEVVEETVTLPA